MALSDTAEYWRDVKSHPYAGPNYFHIPGAECGHRHMFEAKRIGDVNCRGCLKLIKAGYVHNLPEGITVSKAEKRRLAEVKEAEKKYGRCECGALFTPRKNKQTGESFLGCSNYPKCKNTKVYEKKKKRNWIAPFGKYEK